MPPRYSVIVPICHGGLFLLNALASLSSLKTPPGGFEVLIAGEARNLHEEVDFNFAGQSMQFVAGGSNRSEALNAACANAQGQVWIFSDDDCIFPADWLLKVEQSLIRHREASIIGGSDILADGASIFDQALDETLQAFAGTGGIRLAGTMSAGRYYPKLWNMTVWAEAARQAAPDEQTRKLIFNPVLNVHEDVDLVQRIIEHGGKVAYDPNISVVHNRDTDFASFFRRNRAMAQLCRCQGIHRIAHLALLILLSSLLVLGALSFAIPAVFPLFLCVAGAYVLLVLSAGVIAMWRKKQFAMVWLVPALIISLHIARATGFLLPRRFRRGEPS